MPDVQWNKDYWNSEYGWPAHGEEWSDQWGSSKVQWFGTIFPRIAAHVPCETIVEIAPGQGRWTKYLLDLCNTYRGFDISDNTVEFCRKYIAGSGKAGDQQFHVNSGSDFPGVGNASVDFVFSFDSLVHCERDVIEGYLKEIERVLRPGGFAFLHHSNLGMYGISGDDNVHCRGESMSAETFRSLANGSGLKTPVQELISWQSDICQDCLSLVHKPEKGAAGTATKVVFNNGFWNDAARLSETMGPYHD